jgi:hypothetical protein
VWFSIPAQYLAGVQDNGGAALHVFQRDPDPLDSHLPLQALPGHQISQRSTTSFQVEIINVGLQLERCNKNVAFFKYKRLIAKLL